MHLLHIGIFILITCKGVHKDTSKLLKMQIISWQIFNNKIPKILKK